MEAKNLDIQRQYCGFKLANKKYAIPVLSIQEIIRPLNITAVPLAEEFCTGLMNLRGQIVTSISLRKLFQLNNSEDDPKKHMNIIVKDSNGLIALSVDEILDIIDINENEISDVPMTVPEGLKRYSGGIYKDSNELIVLLDVEKLLSRKS